MKHLLFYTLLITTVSLKSQGFVPKDTIILKGISQPNIHSFDANNDGRFDLLVSGKNSTVLGSSRSISKLYYQQADSSLLSSFLDLEISGTHDIVLHDFNRDGLQDLLVSADSLAGPKHFLFLNNEDSTFSRLDMRGLEEEPFGHWQVVDLNNDGKVELALNNEQGNKLFELSDSTWQELDIEVEELDVLSKLIFYDQDKNGYTDILITGPRVGGDSASILIKNIAGDSFQKMPLDDIDSSLVNDYVLNDLDNNGLTDVLISSLRTEKGTRVLFNQPDLTLKDSVLGLNTSFTQAITYSADLNSDGVWDWDLEGAVNDSGVPLRERATSSEDTYVLQQDTLLNTTGLGRIYADFDFDGDLDYVESTLNKDSLSLVIYQNNSLENNGPEKIESFISVKYDGKIFMAWAKPEDDHTHPASISYDVAIGSNKLNAELLAASLNAKTKKRSLSVLGNNVFNNYFIYDSLPTSEIAVNIMPIDNALHYDPLNCFTDELGKDCTDVDLESLVFCEPTTVDLKTPNGESAYWFSPESGFLGEGPSYSVFVSNNVSIVSMFESPGRCSQGKIFEIKVEQPPASISAQVVCNGSEVEVGIVPNYATYSWTSDVSGSVLSESAQLKYVPTENDQITLRVTSDNNCVFTRSFEVQLVTLDIQVADSVLSINEGGSVQLNASGGLRYIWSPAEGLSNSEISNPVASPDKSTTYTVFTFNALGCIAETAVEVNVNQTAFLPDSFSPNGDGRNDFYKIYDLGQTAEFTFTIFDRIGNVLFQTSNYDRAANRGWDGTKNGNLVEAGSYFWRISGTYLDGQQIKINGGVKGGLQLIR